MRILISSHSVQTINIHQTYRNPHAFHWFFCLICVLSHKITVLKCGRYIMSGPISEYTIEYSNRFIRVSGGAIFFLPIPELDHFSGESGLESRTGGPTCFHSILVYLMLSYSVRRHAILIYTSTYTIKHSYHHHKTANVPNG